MSSHRRIIRVSHWPAAAANSRQAVYFSDGPAMTLLMNSEKHNQPQRVQINLILQSMAQPSLMAARYVR